MNSEAAFPIQWENPEDAQRYWTRDTVHEPKPSLPLRRTFSRDIIGAGVGRVHQVLPFPGSSRSIVVNGYTYESSTPDPPDVAQQKLRRLEPLMQAHLADLPRRWHEEYQPELERDLGGWQAFDLQGASWEELVAHFEAMCERLVRHWEIHFLTVFPIMHSTRLLSRMYAQLSGDQDEQAPYNLLAGFPNKTAERDLALWQLSELARESPAVSDALVSQAPHDALPVIRALGDPAARPFVAALDDFLGRYGDRSEGSIERPTWREDPTFVLTMIKGYLAGARRHPAEEERAVANEREQLVVDTLARIPEGEREGFAQTLRRAQAIAPLRETHAHFIDQAGLAYFRYAVMELARRLTQMGVLAKPDDVFYLGLDELRQLTHQPASSNVKSLIERRRADHARWSQLSAPVSIGTPPKEPQPGDSETMKFFRPISTDVPPGPISELKGAAGSRGVAHGRAVVILSTSEFGRVQPGDILVCPTTFPPWTPLFRLIGGLVTDAGGVLSHGAIVAREYKLPAVVGTGYATRVIRDGQMLQIDGGRGVVKILDDGHRTNDA